MKEKNKIIDTTKKKLVIGIVLLLGLALIAQVVYASTNTTNNILTQAQKIVPDKGVLGNPEKIKIEYLKNLPPVNVTEQQRREGIVAKVHIKGPKINQSVLPVGPTNGTETNIASKVRQNPFQVFANDPVGNAGIPAGYKSTVHEPSEAQSNDFQNIFWTANWYAARSTDGGNTFSYVNPYADFSSFCCDQDVVYDQARGMFLWYRQGISDVNGVNYFRLGVSNDNGNTWAFYNVYPTNVNSAWTNQWWDYPQLAIDNNYLYIATNMFDVNGFWTRTVMIQLPLNQLHAQGGVNLLYLPWTANFNFGLAQEVPNSGTNEIFFGSHNTNSNLRIFRWDESSQTIFTNDRAITAWTSGVLHSCPGPDGTDSCQRSDERLTGGWHNGGRVGFFWDVAQGNGFNYPYIESAQFDDVNLAYGCGGACNARPYVWYPSFAWQYGNAAPDISGHLGVDFFAAGGTWNPSHFVGLWDEFTPVPPGWTVLGTNFGTNGPSNNKWGDYIRVRATSIDHLWSGSAYTLQGGQTGSFVDPRYVLFGRNAPSPPTPKLAKITVSPPTATINVSETKGFTATAFDQNNNPMPNINIGWTVSNGTVGSVNPTSGITDINGNTSTTFTALVAGTTNVVATNGSISGNASVTVNAKPPTSVKQMTLVRGSDNALWYRLFDGTSWGSWQSLGGILSSDPDAVSFASGHVAVVAKGSDNALWIRTWDGTTWASWQSLGGVINSGPTVASPSTNKLDVFAKGSDSALWYRTFNGTTWSDWNSLGGILSSDPDAANSLDIAVKGSDNALWIRPYNTSTNTWDNWKSLGGILSAGPSITSFGSKEDVFARGSDNALWYRTFDGTTWGSWQSLGGSISSDPDATSIQSGTPTFVEVVVKGSDNALWYMSWDGTAWSAWKTLGGILNSGPTVASWT